MPNVRRPVDAAPPRLRVPALMTALHDDLFAFDQQPAPGELHDSGAIERRDDIRIACPQRGQVHFLTRHATEHSQPQFQVADRWLAFPQ
jgi:hypothetical protein